jgi:hypothetical protein
VIFVSSIHLVLENPLNDPSGKLSYVLIYIDYVLTTIFALECVLKLIAFGFFIEEDSYFRNFWNIMDFTIVITSLLSASLPTLNLNVLKVIRLFRILRPLKLIAKNDGLKVSIQALMISIPNILNLLLISSLFFLIFMIIGVNFFKGLLYYCNDN